MQNGDCIFECDVAFATNKINLIINLTNLTQSSGLGAYEILSQGFMWNSRFWMDDLSRFWMDDPSNLLWPGVFWPTTTPLCQVGYFMTFLMYQKLLTAVHCKKMDSHHI